MILLNSSEKFYINYFSSKSRKAQNEFREAFTQIMLDRKENIGTKWKLIRNEIGEIIGYEEDPVANNP